MLNKVQLIGHLGADPDVRRTEDGTVVATISIATSEKWTDKNSGQKREQTQWHRVVAWRGVAEIAEKYLSKGSKVYIEGKLQTRKWTDDKGLERYTTEVILSGFAGKLIMLDSKGDRDRNSPPHDDTEPHGAYNQASNQVNGQGHNLDDDIPF